MYPTSQRLSISGYFFLFCLADGMTMGLSEFFCPSTQIFFFAKMKRNGLVNLALVVLWPQSKTLLIHLILKEWHKERGEKSLRFFFLCVSVGFCQAPLAFLAWFGGTNCIIAMNEMRKEVFDVDVVWQKVRVRHGSHSWMVIQGHGWFENRWIHCQMNWILD